MLSKSSVVSVASMLIGLGAGLVLARFAHLAPGTVVLGTMVGMSLGRSQQSATRSDRVAGFVVVPLVAAGASALSGLLVGRWAIVGSAVFVLALSATVWVRRFGPRATKLGAIAVLPLLSLLFAPAESPLWSGVTAAVVFLLVSVMQVLAGSGEGVLNRPASGAASTKTNTKMAVQLGVALAGAFVVGRLVWPTHWQWVVLTAFIVCAGNRGGGDVLHKSGLRVLGAAVGTLAATGLLALVTPSGIGCVAAILVVLIAGIVLRPVSYAYWAACVTAAMALLLGLFGEDAAPLLLTRLGAIVVGAVLGVAASWLILPIRSRDVARRRIGEAREAIERLRSGADGEGEGGGGADGDGAHVAVRHAIAQLDLIAPAFDAHRRLYRLVPGSRRRDKHFIADTFDELRAECAGLSRAERAGSR